MLQLRLDALKGEGCTVEDLIDSPTIGPEKVELLKAMADLELVKVVPLTGEMDGVAVDIIGLHLMFPAARIEVRFDGELTLPGVFAIAYELGLVHRSYPDWFQWIDIDVANNDPVLFSLCQKVIGAY